MNFDEIRRMTELLKLLKTLQSQRDILAWLRENKELVRGMRPDELEEVRERADYDAAAWQDLLRQLLNS